MNQIYCRYIQHKLFEWAMAWNMLLTAMLLISVPAAIKQSAFKYVALFLSPTLVGYVMLVFGVFRLVALFANGQSDISRKYGPYLRIVGAMAGGFVWFQMELSLWMLLTETHIPSPGLSVWFCLTIGEICSIYQAGKDAQGRY